MWPAYRTPHETELLGAALARGELARTGGVPACGALHAVASRLRAFETLCPNLPLSRIITIAEADRRSDIRVVLDDLGAPLLILAAATAALGLLAHQLAN